MTRPTFLSWYDSDRLPELLPDPAVIVGGTALLRQFIDIVALSSGGQLSIAAPFASKGMRSSIPSWESLPHGLLELSLLTNTRRDAATVLSEIGSLPWRSLRIGYLAGLHAKLYVIMTPGGTDACLVGSHNLTRSAALWNVEAGVLFVSRRGAEVTRVIQVCHDHIHSLATQSTTVIDTLRWPLAQAC
jgi:hypothetical protein